MPVYMIQAGGLPIVKIGKADNVRERLSNLQVSHWETLRLIRQFEGGAAEEAALHLMFADMRHRGEWFSWTRRMLGDVGLVDIPLNLVANLKPPVVQDFNPDDASLTHAEIVEALGGVMRLAAALGDTNPNTVRYWTRGRRSIPSDRWGAIAALDIAKVRGITAALLSATRIERKPRSAVSA